MEQTKSSRARFGIYELDLRVGELHSDGESVLLPEQVFQVLHILVERGGNLVTRDELKKKLWPNDTVVEFEHGINNTIKRLRKALGDSADQPKYIETIPRRGYRLMMPVEWVSPAEVSSAEKSSADSGESSGSDSEILPKAKLKVGRLTGKVVSHYRVLEVIGGGGMGLVYRAEDLKLGRAVALKFLPEEVGDDPKARGRFEREAHAVSALNHANICTVYDFDEHEGHPFIAMELLQGKTLRDHIADGRFRLTQPEGLEVAIQIASGLEAAHEKGIIHRDIKPANIFITEKSVAKILDFGVAKVLQLSEGSENPHPANSRPDGAPGNDPFPAVILSEERSDESKDPYNPENLGQVEVPRLAAQPQGGSLSMTDQNGGAAASAKETTLTRTGMKLGTAGYMSPEQIRGEPLDARTDIFSFGLVLYEMATGERAFTGETEAIVHDAIQHCEPKPVREIAPECSPGLQDIIHRCLRKSLDSRYQSVAEARLDLENVSAAPSGGRKLFHWRRHWLAIAAIATVCAAGSWLSWRLTRTPKLKAGATIILALTDNTTNDAVLDQALGNPLRVEFQQTPFFNALADNKLRETLRALKQPDDSRLTPDLARRVCLQTNSDAVVQSSIKDAGNRYVIELKGVQCDNGAEIARAQVQADRREQIVRMLGAAGAQLRAKLGEPAESVKAYNTPLDEATSASLEALQAVVQGWKVRAQQGDAAALPYYKEAVELDPQFAMAQHNIGLIYSNLGENAHAVDSLRAAFAFRDRATQRDKTVVEAEYYSVVTGEIDKTIAAYERGVEIFPHNFTYHANLSYHLRIAGQPERSAAEAREAFRVAPFYAQIYNLALSEMALGRPENAKRALDEGQKLGFEAYELRLARYLLAFCQGDRATMQQQVAWAMGKPTAESALISKEAETTAFGGQFRKARSLVARAANSAQQEGASETSKRLFLEQAFREAEVGNAGLAQNILRKIRPLTDDVYMSSVAPITMANSGDIASASNLSRRTSDNHPLDTLAQKFWLPATKALIDMHENDPGQAIKKLEVSREVELAQPGVFEPFGNMYPTYVRGLAYLKANQGENAAKEFQKIVDHQGLVGNFIIGALAHLQLARAQAMMGDKEAARKSYQDFLTLWKDADPDIPIYRQAKAEYKKLRATSN